MSYDLTDDNHYFLDTLYEENVTANNVDLTAEAIEDGFALNLVRNHFDNSSDCDDTQIKNTINNIVDNLTNEQMDELICGSDSDDSIAPSPEYDVIASAYGLELCQSMVHSSKSDIKQTDCANVCINSVNAAIDDNSNDTFVTVQECTETVQTSLTEPNDFVDNKTKATNTARIFGQRKRKYKKRISNLNDGSKDKSKNGFKVKRNKRSKLNDSRDESKTIIDCALFGNIEFGNGSQSECDKQYALQCENWFKRETRIQNKS